MKRDNEQAHTCLKAAKKRHHSLCFSIQLQIKRRQNSARGKWCKNRMTPVSSRRRDKQVAPLHSNKTREESMKRRKGGLSVMDGDVIPFHFEVPEFVETWWRPLHRAVKCVQHCQTHKRQVLVCVHNTTDHTITPSSVRSSISPLVCSTTMSPAGCGRLRRATE